MDQRYSLWVNYDLRIATVITDQIKLLKLTEPWHVWLRKRNVMLPVFVFFIQCIQYYL
jgi:hypothetical protein